MRRCNLTLLILTALIIACGGSEVVEPTISLLPTYTPYPTYTIVPTPRPELVYVEVTPTPDPTKASTATPAPTAPTKAPTDHAATEEPQEVKAPTPEAQPTPTYTPKPPPTPRYRVAQREVNTSGDPSFAYTSGPVINGFTLSFSALIDGQNKEPTQVQVWQALSIDDYGGRCTTERPIAFVAKGSSYGSTDWSWDYCVTPGTKPVRYSEPIPWVAPSAWSYSQRPRKQTWEPYLYDWSFAVDLSDERITEIDYRDPAGHIVLVFSGDNLLSRTWIDGE